MQEKTEEPREGDMGGKHRPQGDESGKREGQGDIGKKGGSGQVGPRPTTPGSEPGEGP